MMYAEWTKQDDATLRNLFEKGLSFSDIGRELGRTTNSAIGRAKRLGFPGRGKTHSMRVAKKAAGMVTVYRTLPPQERKPPMPQRVTIAPDSQPVDLMTRSGCCYPTTTEGPHLFCNAPRAHGIDYCEFHVRVMYPRRAA